MTVFYLWSVSTLCCIATLVTPSVPFQPRPFIVKMIHYLVQRPADTWNRYPKRKPLGIVELEALLTVSKSLICYLHFLVDQLLQ